MILYVSVTAVLNIALGFVLAMYLYRAGLLGASRAVAETHEEHHAEPEAHAPAAHSEPASVAAAPAEPAPMAAPVEAAVTPEVAEAPAAELEENVLAGIEEFRNQLAQMKAQPAEAAEAAHA